MDLKEYTNLIVGRINNKYDGAINMTPKEVNQILRYYLHNIFSCMVRNKDVNIKGYFKITYDKKQCFEYLYKIKTGKKKLRKGSLIIDKITGELNHRSWVKYKIIKKKQEAHRQTL
jgi:hypothetical protein